MSGDRHLGVLSAPYPGCWEAFYIFIFLLWVSAKSPTELFAFWVVLEENRYAYVLLW